MVTKICEYCGKEFKVKPSRAEKAKYCSYDCVNNTKKSKRVILKCDECGKESIVKKSRAENEHEHHFCSLKCLGIFNGRVNSNKIEEHCIICGKSFFRIPSRITAITCSVECQAIWQSQNRIGENAPSWQGGDVECQCLNCGKQFEVDRGAYNRGTVKYCSKECQAIGVFSQPEVRAKQIEVTKNKWLDPEYRKIMQASVLHTLSTYPRETSIEKMTRERLEENNINHIPQHIINNKFCVDFYLPDHNVVIEVLGDYFHANPLIYGNENDGLKLLNDIQKKNIKSDKSRFAYLRKCGYSVYGFWECDIRTKLDELMESITELHCEDIKGCFI